uniref:C1 family peptidase n=1 Tax=uncultured Methanobrevibacter sp. TaxID=253161 RepID=UPI00262B8C8F
LFISLGAVCATESISDDDLSEDKGEHLEIVEETIIGEDSQNPTGNDNLSKNSFTQLENDINSSTDILEITHDYKFDNDTDNFTRISFVKNNFVINGNNHIIDANNISAIFSVTGTNITINNLVFRNANSYSGSVLYINSESTVTTNNVTFENCAAEYGIILTALATYISNDDKFLDCTASEGVIFGHRSNLIFNNSLMRSSKNLKWGFIKTEGLSFTGVFNSIFANTTSKYTTAIMGSGRLEIVNTTFINLHANLTAGAIGLKDIEEAYLKNCNFNDVNSEKNGGAIFTDAYSSGEKPTVEIIDSNFVDCYSQFGGAILQLEGILDVDNCNFTNNLAVFDGGAIYVSWTNMTVSNSRFNNNSAVYDDKRGSFGGAIFADASTFTLKKSEFIKNSAQDGSAIYMYDTDYDIKDNLFENNSDLNGTYDDIYSAFDSTIRILENNTYSANDSISLNNIIYDLISVTPALKLPIINNSIEVESIPSQFDLRDWGWVTPVRNQGSSGVCWSFGISGAMESSILRFLDVEMDISENNLADVSFRYNRYGSTNVHEGGGFNIGANYALSWLGVFPSVYDVYDELGKISPAIGVNSSIHFQDIVCIRPCANATDMDHVKKAVLKYGALYVRYYAAQDEPFFNEETSAQYCDDESVKVNHGVVLVGWDDTYSKENFLITPPGDGAWIFKNSWGEDAGNEGYFYISYYDSTFMKNNDAYAFIFINDVDYNKNYQYDLQGSFITYDLNEYRNNFVAIEDDLIAGVETYFKDAGSNYTVEIYVNGKLMHVQNGLSPFAGYHTIKLDSYVPIKQGDEFTVKIKSNCLPGLAYSRQHFINNSSEFLYNGTWTDAAEQGFVCCIKAFTVADDTQIINNDDISVDYAGGKYFSVKVVTADGHAVGAGAEVKFTISGKTTPVFTDKNGIAKIKITQTPGKYSIKTVFNGKTYSNKVTVKQVITASKVTVKKTAKKFTLKAKLKINGKLVKGKWITFKFNGKTYKVKTNSKGIAQKTLKKNVIKKFKKGKKYTVKVIYLKDTIKTTVKVK